MEVACVIITGKAEFIVAAGRDFVVYLDDRCAVAKGGTAEWQVAEAGRSHTVAAAEPVPAEWGVAETVDAGALREKLVAGARCGQVPVDITEAAVGV